MNLPSSLSRRSCRQLRRRLGASTRLRQASEAFLSAEVEIGSKGGSPRAGAGVGAQLVWLLLKRAKKKKIDRKNLKTKSTCRETFVAHVKSKKFLVGSPSPSLSPSQTSKRHASLPLRVAARHRVGSADAFIIVVVSSPHRRRRCRRRASASLSRRRSSADLFSSISCDSGVAVDRLCRRASQAASPFGQVPAHGRGT